MRALGFFILVGVIFYLGNAQTADKSIHSVADLEQLYRLRVYPMNKLTDTTYNRLKENIVFTDIGTFIGFKYSGGLFKELTEEEQKTFFNLLSGYPIKE